MEHWWNDICRVNRSTREKPVPLPLSPPQISRRLTWDPSRATGMRDLTA